jgi:hypothetical protein
VVTADWQRRADQLAAESLARSEPVAWFERLFAEGAAGSTSMPWDRREPHPLLADWAAGRDLAGPGRAVVPGCGLGADAAFLAGLGLSVTGFDVSGTAVEVARRRFPGPDFRQADLFAPAPLWLGALVVQAVLGAHDDPDEGPPWPLTCRELDSFAGGGLDQAVVEIRDGLWRAEFCRAAD